MSNKNTWPCLGKPEDLKGQPIGMYHCEFCGEMQIAGISHLVPQFPEQWEEPFPKDLDPTSEDLFPVPAVEDPPAVVTSCPVCASSSITFTREEEYLPYGAPPHVVELTVLVDKGRCATCSFEFTDWRAEKARDRAVHAYLGITPKKEPL